MRRGATRLTARERWLLTMTGALMTPPDASSVEILGTGTSGPQPSQRRPRLLAVAVALVAAGGAAAAVLSADRTEESAPVAFVHDFIGAWNDRDSQAVSSMTCDHPGAFIAAGIVEDYMDRAPEDEQIVADHDISGTEAAVLDGREVVRVGVRYIDAGGDARERNVFVRVRDDGEMCVGQFVSW
jgi:hypothetical protein